MGEAAGGPSSRGIASLSTGTASRLALAGERVSADGITDCGAASLNSAATLALGDDLVSNFASAAGAGNSARRFVSTVVTFSGMALNASATLAFGAATLGRDTAI